MDHAEVVEQIEIAAAEPGGLDRLTAGDTPEAAAVAGHLAGCEACADALVRTRRAAAAAHDVIRELPDPALRERTLSFVREVGRARSAGATGMVAAPWASVPAASVPAPAASRGRRRWWFASAVAAVVVAGMAGFVAGGVAHPLGPRGDGVVAMAAAQTTMHIAEQPDAVRIALASTTGLAANGTVLFSITTREVAMTAVGLGPAPEGAAYVGWLEQGGQRQRLGALLVEGSFGTWSGTVDGLARLAPGARFGVSLVAADGQGETPVLAGN